MGFLSMHQYFYVKSYRKVRNRYTIVPAPFRIELNTIKYHPQSRYTAHPYHGSTVSIGKYRWSDYPNGAHRLPRLRVRETRQKRKT